jgi:hypothetical protein
LNAVQLVHGQPAVAPFFGFASCTKKVVAKVDFLQVCKLDINNFLVVRNRISQKFTEIIIWLRLIMLCDCYKSVLERKAEKKSFLILAALWTKLGFCRNSAGASWADF